MGGIMVFFPIALDTDPESILDQEKIHTELLEGSLNHLLGTYKDIWISVLFKNIEEVALNWTSAVRFKIKKSSSSRPIRFTHKDSSDANFTYFSLKCLAIETLNQVFHPFFFFFFPPTVGK